MKLKLFSFSVPDLIHDEQNPYVRAGLLVVFADKDARISGNFDVEFDHENPRSLTFLEVEEIAIRKALSLVEQD